MNAPEFSGILNINKPLDVTSRHVVDVVQRLVRPAKAGHGGTLDPLATGVLVVCVGPATRLISHVQQGRKEYRARFVLGQRSDTDDVSGEVEPVAGAQAPPLSDIEESLREQVGEIDQVPPQFSAVHVDGRRAYKLARVGKEFDLPPRRVEVFRIDVLNYDYPQLDLEIECGSGTYIRSIGRDVGRKLGCGAVMSDLVRTRVGDYRLEAALELKSLSRESLPAALLNPLTALEHLPRHICAADDVDAIRHGRAIPAGDFAGNDTDELIAVVTPDDQLAALAVVKGDRLTPKNVFVR